MVDGGERPLGTGGLREALSRLGDPVRTRALLGLDLLVAAEAAVHGCDPSEVHLHELGTADTAADLAGAAVALHSLGISQVSAAPVPLGTGWAQTDHGPIPLPGPVVLHLLRGAVVDGVPAGSETVTPTGVAILVAHDASFGPMPTMQILATGTGAGSQELDHPNVCRVLVGEPVPGGSLETVVLLEANVDDQTPEALGHAIRALLDDGALDAWCTPIVMKGSRPAVAVSVLVRAPDEPRVVRTLFRATSTLGVRRRETDRWVLPREVVTVEVMGRRVRVKLGLLDGQVVTVSPEYADCAQVAQELGLPLDDVYAQARVGARRS